MEPPSTRKLCVSEEYVEVGGVRLFARASGSGELMLFLHGFPEHGAIWRRQTDVLSGAYRTVAFDGRGHGQSDCPPSADSYLVEQLVSDIIELADHFGEERFILAGHDWGGVIAWFTAALHPDRVSRLVVVNAPHPTLFQRSLDGVADQQQASGYIARLTAPQADQLTPDQLWAATLQTADKQGLLLAGEREALLKSWSRPGAIPAMLNWYRAAPFDFSPVGGAGGGRWNSDLIVRVPTLLIWGMDDPLLKQSLLEGLHDLVPDLEIAAMPGVGHSPVRERPDAVTQIMSDYLSRRRDAVKPEAPGTSQDER
jgi:pimeloyl-ACP methyl ester carboxylesterase